MGSKNVRKLSRESIDRLVPNLRDPVSYRKSGLSLNHIIGCPLDCAYCIRHKDHNYEMKQPRSVLSDEEAVNYLVSHKFFQANITPIQLFNKATDAFLPNVKSHLFRTLKLLDKRGLSNHVLVITRYKITAEDCDALNEIQNLRLSILITYSGIDDARIEPIDNAIPINSLKTAHRYAKAYRVILYWRPIVPGLNDSDEKIRFALDTSAHAHAMVFTGLFYNEAIRRYFAEAGLPNLYDESARRKILPQELEARILKMAIGSPAEGRLFRKTSCGVAFAQATHDYNGHYGIQEICDICPQMQVGRCARAFRIPNRDEVMRVAERIGVQSAPFTITERAIEIEGLEEEPRYYLQHTLDFQVHDVRYPHHYGRHGRAEIGWSRVPTEQPS
jgi:DNA repair photolyase